MVGWEGCDPNNQNNLYLFGTLGGKIVANITLYTLIEIKIIRGLE